MNHDAIVLLVRIIHAILGAAKQTPVFFEGLVRDPRSLIMLAVTFAAEAASLLILIRSRRRSMIPRRCLLIGIGAAVTRRPLPHHRAYGSVHGGSGWLR